MSLKVEQKKSIFLFDVDGTLTKPRNKVTPDVLNFLKDLHNHVEIGIIGGSDLSKIKEQLGEDLLSYAFVDYVFSENGLVAYKGKHLINQTSLCAALGEDKVKSFINFCLHYLADLDIPIKRGTFIEMRQGNWNISPIGRNCSQKERDEFEAYDKVHKVRQEMMKELESRFVDYDLKYSVGGQISFDVFKKGWDKTYCLQFLEGYDTIHFFGDKTQPGGNDYEIYSSPLVTGHSVNSYMDTIEQCNAIVNR